jgi:anti-sigma regulatory factor (Ser/Thr protein kinase)
VSFRPHDTAPALGRRTLDGLADLVPSATLDDARLLLTEVMTNAIRHAGAREDESISMLLRVTESELFIEVTDRGRGFGPGGVGAAGTGWGLFLLDRLSDAWGVSERDGGGAAVWFRLRWRDGRPGRPASIR